jgi:hypothetical protein
VRRQLLTIIRAFVIYKPFRFFVTVGGVLFLAGFLVGLRFLVYYMSGGGSGHVQSLILSALSIGIGLLLAVAGLIADLMAVNRTLLEQLDTRMRRVEARIAPDAP